MDLSIIIVNYNVKYFLENAIHSIINSCKNFKYEIIIIDNASKDDSVEYIQKKFKSKLKIINNKKNIGFSKASNQGLKIAKGKFILLINPDIILKKNTIPVLIDYFNKNHNTYLLTCKIISPDGKLDPSCHRSFPKVWNSFCHITGISKIFKKSKNCSSYNMLYKPENEIFEVEAISGCFMMFRRKIIDDGIFLSEKYFLYGEDLDFCYKIKQKGYKIEYVPLTETIHFRGQSSKKNSLKSKNHFYKSMNIFINENYSAQYSLFFKIFINIAIFLSYISSIVKLLIIKFFLPILDIISYYSALLISVYCYKPLINIFHLEKFVGKAPITIKMYLQISVVYLFIYILIFTLTRLYGKLKFSRKTFFNSCFYISMISIAITYFMKFFAYSRIILFLMLLISIIFMFLWRLIILKKLKLFYKKTIVIGIDKISKNLVNHETSLGKEGQQIIGYVDISNENLGNTVGKYPVFGNIETLKNVLTLEKIESVIFSIKSIHYDKIVSIKDYLRKNKLDFTILPDSLIISKGKIQFLVIKNN